MTEQELNLRKEKLIELIRTMNEEELEQTENHIRQLLYGDDSSNRLRFSEDAIAAEPVSVYRKSELTYPFHPTREELVESVRNAEQDYLEGKYYTQEEVDAIFKERFTGRSKEK